MNGAQDRALWITLMIYAKGDVWSLLNHLQNILFGASNDLVWMVFVQPDTQFTIYKMCVVVK